MDISYDLLTSSSSGWKDGLHWLEDLESWSLVYEAEHMTPSASNAKLAQATLNVALTNVPAKIRPLGTQIAATLFEPRLRQAMMYVFIPPFPLSLFP